MKIFIKVSLFLFFVYVDGESITLDGQWTGIIKSCNETLTSNCDYEITFPAVVPGGIFTDLFRENLIPNNLIGGNDVKNRWIGNKTVIYSKNFRITKELLSLPKIELVFHGLDTFATIYLNNVKIGETSNMFLRHSFDVKKHLKLSNNTVSVSFTSPVKEAERLFVEQNVSYPVPPICVPKEYNGICHVNHIRKMQASFSWDWGPAFPSMGIWKSVELQAAKQVFITDFSTVTEKSRFDKLWYVITKVFFDLSTYERKQLMDVEATSVLYLNNTNKISSHTFVRVGSHKQSGSITVYLSVPEDMVELWWPNGYGEPTLYNILTTISTPHEVASRAVRVGFRKVELVEEPLKNGLSFYFRINDIPIFAKGSNYIPSSVFPESIADESTIRHLMESVKSTHMNMLRVWGGGIYESELFYDLADEYGIMIWQDLMFACAMYPTTEEFLDSVKEEVQQNVRRLNNHPSIVLWAGNNENEAALYGNWYGTGQRKVYRDDYVKLYVYLIKQLVKKLDPNRPFLVSSPSNGRYTETYNYTGENPYSNLYGDVHYYNYIRNGWDINQYPHTRFSSEYGFQSIPSIYTLAAAAETVDDLRLDSEFMQHRQHLPAGYPLMRALVSKNLIIPKTGHPLTDFVDYIYLSQINQAVSIQVQTELYRQLRSELSANGEGMTMGALYWQLNDVWQAPSWSSIEFGGRWKMLHYYAQNFFAPIIVTSRMSVSSEVSLHVVSDELREIRDCVLKMHVYLWNSTKPIYAKIFEGITVEPNSAQEIASVWLNMLLVEAGCGSLETGKKNCIVTLSLANSTGDLVAPMNYIYPTVLKEANMLTAYVKVKIDERVLPGKLSNYADIELELTASNIALFVWLEVDGIRGRFSENGFHMFENTKKVIFHAQESTTPALLQKHLKITTLSDIYQANRDPFDASKLLLERR